MADSVFIPILNAIVYIFDIPETIAGMTIIAFGNGAPDVFSIYTSFSKGVTRLGLGELLGAGILVSIMTVGIIAILRPTKLHWFAVNRDLGFFLGALMILGVFLVDGQITLLESIFLIVYYGIYMLFSISVAFYFMDIIEEEVPLSPTLSATNRDFEVDTFQNLDDSNGDLVPAITSPSELSLIQDPNFDADYFLGDQPESRTHRHLPLKRYGSNSSGLSFSSWQRRAFHQAIPSPENDVNDDALDFMRIEADSAPSIEVECKQTFNILFPIYSNWKLLSFFERVFAVLQSPLILLLNLTLPVMDKDYITKCHEYIPVYPLPDPTTVEEEYRLHYPRLLLVFQILLLPIMNAFLQGGKIFLTQC